MKKIEKLKNGRIRVYTQNDEKSMTDQSFKEDCDVNNIVNTYLKTGQMPHVSNKIGYYADVSEIPDLLEATIRIDEAKKAFDELPAKIRREFDDSPQKFLEFVSNPENLEKGIKLGIYEEIKPIGQNDDQTTIPPITEKPPSPTPKPPND